MDDSKSSYRPYSFCSLALIGLAMVSQIVLFTNNMIVGDSIKDMGESANGWSEAGISFAEAVGEDINEALHESSNHLSYTLTSIAALQDLMGDGTQLAKHTPKPDLAHVLIQTKLVQEAAKMYKFLMKILDRVKEWLISFGPKLQSTIQSLSGVIDKIQKLFDQVMAIMSGKAELEDELLHETYNLFDASNTGKVNPSDFVDVADLYGLPQLKGSKAMKLFKKYDKNNDSGLDKKEFREFITDKALPNSMPVVLRQYAKSLLAIAGSMKAAKTRKEVADSVAHYLTLVAQKNKTKVNWISETLTNGSVPIDFTADVLAQLCENAKVATGNHSQLATGAIVKVMAHHHLDKLNLAVKKLTNSHWWVAGGYDKDDQSDCVKTVSAATASAGPAAKRMLLQVFNSPVNSSHDEMVFIEEDGTEEWDRALEDSLLMQGMLRDSDFEEGAKIILDEVDVEGEVSTSAISAMAMRHAEENCAAHADKRRMDSVKRRLSVSAESAKTELQRMLQEARHNIMIMSNDPDAVKAVQSTIPAKPETLAFASNLQNNATATAHRFNTLAMNYSGKSSNTLSSIAGEVDGVVKKVENFLKQFQNYATPEGVDRIEKMVGDFIKALLQKAVAHVKEAEKHAEGKDKAHAKDIQSKANAAIAAAKAAVGEALGPNHPSLLIQTESGELTEAVNLTAIWLDMSPFVSAIKSIIPALIKDIRFGRKEVSALSHGTHQMFDVFKRLGPPILDGSGDFWKTVWTIYFVVAMALLFWFLYFSLYSSDFFMSFVDTKQTVQEDDDTSGTTKVWNCCCVCLSCSTYGSNNKCVWWSMAIMCEVLLLIFCVVSIVMLLVFAANILFSGVCGELYIVLSREICTEALSAMGLWLPTFSKVGNSTIDDACEAHNLLTCDIVQNKLVGAIKMDLLACLFTAVTTYLVLIDSAAMFEKARYAKSEKEDDKDKSQQASSSHSR